MLEQLRLATACGVLLLGFSLPSCIGVSASQQAGCPTEGGEAAGPATTNASAADLKVCSGDTNLAADGSIDDFEDGDSQLTEIDGRDGYWWKHADPSGSTIEPEEFTAVEAGSGSALALHYFGKTSAAPDAYGSSFGVNFSSAGVYDASKYVGLVFKAKVSAESAKKIRFKIGDINTHPDAGGGCGSCWNHFGKDLTLTAEWHEYQILFKELEQAPGWGDPRPPAIDPSKLYSLDWTIPQGSGAFEIWVDDVHFIDCK